MLSLKVAKVLSAVLIEGLIVAWALILLRRSKNADPELWIAAAKGQVLLTVATGILTGAVVGLVILVPEMVALFAEK